MIVLCHFAGFSLLCGGILLQGGMEFLSNLIPQPLGSKDFHLRPVGEEACLEFLVSWHDAEMFLFIFCEFKLFSLKKGFFLRKCFCQVG